jgi:hypothetical protein
LVHTHECVCIRHSNIFVHIIYFLNSRADMHKNISDVEFVVLVMNVVQVLGIHKVPL